MQSLAPKVKDNIPSQVQKLHENKSIKNQKTENNKFYNVQNKTQSENHNSQKQLPQSKSQSQFVKLALPNKLLFISKVTSHLSPTVSARTLKNNTTTKPSQSKECSSPRIQKVITTVDAVVTQALLNHKNHHFKNQHRNQKKGRCFKCFHYERQDRKNKFMQQVKRKKS